MDTNHSTHERLDTQLPVMDLEAPRWRAIMRHFRISPREEQVIALIFENTSEVAIGRALGISAHTVHVHIARIYRKTRARSRCGLVLQLFAVYLTMERHMRAEGGHGGGATASSVRLRDTARQLFVPSMDAKVTRSNS
jgi:DNA-binding CsgD family transcriptional regulator